MIVTPPTSVQAQRQPTATPTTAVVAGNPIPGDTLNGLSHAPRVAPPFIDELQRLSATLAVPLPLLSRASLQTGTVLQTSKDSQASDHPDETIGSETPLAAMQLPFMPLPVLQLVAAPTNTQAVVTSAAATHAAGLQTWGSPMSVPTEAALAPGTGLAPATSMNPAPGATAFGELASSVATTRVAAPSALLAGATASSEPITASAPATAEHVPATRPNIDMRAALGSLSPEATAVRERSTGHGTTVPTADPLAQTLSVPNGDPSVTQTTTTHSSGTATRAPQTLVDTLGDRIDWQLKTGSERAVIRLDPPMQGQLEITIRRDASAIQVHLSATHGDVVKQLQSISDTLRQELTGRQAGDVVVVVSHSATSGRDTDGRGRQPGQAPEQAEPGRALAEAESGQANTRFALSKSL